MLHQTDGTHHETLVTQDEDVGLKIEESDSVWIEERSLAHVMFTPA